MKNINLVFVMLLVVLLSSLVHGVAINSTHADGLVGYGELNVQIPRYRLWNASNNFGAEVSALTTGGDITWVVTKASPKRDEIIMGVEDKANDVSIQVYNGSWTNLLEVSTNVPNSGRKAFDIAYEDISGDALIAFETSTANDATISYRIWNGTGYTAAQTVTLGPVVSPVSWVRLESRAGTDEIMLIAHSSQRRIYAIPWNGTTFETGKGFLLSADTNGNNARRFGFKWEEQSGDGLAVYGQQNGLAYRSYTGSSGTWGGQTLIDIGGRIRSVRTCSDPTSDYIGILFKDLTIQQRVRMWNGSQILAGNPTADPGTRRGGQNNANIDCVWETSGSSSIFGFVDITGTGNNGNEFIDYFTFTKPNTWSTANLASTFTSPTFATDDITSLRFTQHPVTDEFMVVAMDDAEDISAIRWNGSEFVTMAASPIEISTEVTNGDQEGVHFTWYKYDPAPVITNINPNGINFDINSVISVNATVTDNLNISTVLANITLPNGTIQQLILLDTNADNIYNSTLLATSLAGTYIVTVIANDTSLHQNSNTGTANFTVGDVTAPNVTIILPLSGTVFNQSDNVTIRVNVTDNVNVSSVIANITLPNGSINQLTLQINLANNVTYENNFTGTTLFGAYNVRIIANDTSNNFNSSEITIFGVGEIRPPSVVNLTPIAGTNFAVGTTINITANVTDNVNVSSVTVNITLPDNSSSQLTLLDPDNNSVYAALFTTTTQSGTYNITFIANDTSNNINNTESTYFTIGDLISPQIVLNSPANNTNTSSQSVTFDFTVTDNLAGTLNCSLILDNVNTDTNSATPNGTATTFTQNSITEGSHNWSISCNDPTGNSNNSVTRIFRVDTSPPQFISLTTDPSSEADLDPEINITVMANVTDNITTVDIVVLQYKLSTDSSYTNSTTVLNTSDGLYYSSFNATLAGTYNLRLFANDTLGNSDISNVENISVELDRGWSRDPIIFSPLLASINENVTLGNITFNNTADYIINFTTVSDSNSTVYNQSENFSLNSGASYNLRINDSSSSVGVKTIVYTLNASVNETIDADPISLTTTGTIVVAPGQPVLTTNFINPSGNTLQVKQGDVNVEFEAELENIGLGNATNVSMFFTMPSEWIVTFGSDRYNFSVFTAGSRLERSISFTIPSDFTPGDYTVLVNVTGLNSSGFSLEDLGFVFGDSITVTVGTAILGTQTGSGGGGGGGGGSSRGGFARAPVNTTCLPVWSCTRWSTCLNGFTSRTCSDENQCSQKMTTGKIDEIIYVTNPIRNKTCVSAELIEEPASEKPGQEFEIEKKEDGLLDKIFIPKINTPLTVAIVLVIVAFLSTILFWLRKRRKRKFK